MRGIDFLKCNNVPFNIICVITKNSLGYAQEIYEFFSNLGCERLGVNVEELEGLNRIGSFVNDTYDAELRKFMETLFQLWIRNPRSLMIREFSGLIAAIAAGQYDLRAQEATPFRIINVDVEGNFAPFSPELLGRSTHHGTFAFGNVWNDSFDSLAGNERLIRLYDEFCKGRTKCAADCAYYSLCGGGTLSNKFNERNTFDCTETRYCITNKQILIEEGLRILEQEVQRFLQPALAAR
jgi:uncharacterized protein